MRIDSSFNGVLGIIGAGGLGKEVLCCLGDITGWKEINSRAVFLVEEGFAMPSEVHGIKVLPFAEATKTCSCFIIAIGDATARDRLRKQLPSNSIFATLIHPDVRLTPFTTIGEGTIVLSRTFLSVDVNIGSFSLVNPGTTISHDCTIGDFFTGSPGVNISGNVLVGRHVFMGTNASIRNAIEITDHVVIGMGAVVTRDISQAGTYIGNPASLV